MNSEDYKEALSGIKPSNNLNDRIVAHILNIKEDKIIVPKKNSKKRIVLICAFILLLSSISVAAATWKLSDIFKGYFIEHISGSKANKQAEIKNEAAFLNTTGAIIKSTDTEAGLKLTATGVVGDDRVLYAAIDVETVKGNAFTKKQEAKLNAIHFENVILMLDDDVSTEQYCHCTRIDDGSKKGKATYIIHESINTSNINKISGHKVTIELSNFLHTTNKLTYIGMKGSLYDIFTQFDKPEDKDFRYYSLRSKGKLSDKENKVLKEYYLMRRSGKLTGDKLRQRKEELIKAGLLQPLYYLPKSSKKISFSTKYPKLDITNMGIKENIFTFDMNINGVLDYSDLLNNRITLVNRKTGECVNTIMDIDEGDTGHKKLLSAHFYVIGAITAEEQLKDYYLAIGGDGAEEIINRGTWKLNFKLDYKDTTRSYAVNKAAKLSGFTGTVKNIYISPLSMKISYKTDKPMNAENKAIFEDSWSGGMYLILKDGTKITDLSCSMYEEESKGIYTFNAILPYVINQDQIKKIVIDGAEILMN